MKVKYCFFILLLTFCACSSSTDVKPPSPPGGDDSSSVSSAEPLTITLPRADFTEVSKIKKHVRSKVITQRLIGLIDATPKEASIYLSPDRLKDNMDRVIDAIKGADIRGVDLHIMLDMSSDGNRKANKSTIKKLKLIDRDMDVVEIRIVPDGNGVNHNKFNLFSKVVTKTGEARNVVFTTSQNMFPNAEKKNQNAVTLSDGGLYQAYLGYWQDMKKYADNGKENYTYRKYSDPDNGIYAFFYPKTKNRAYFGPDPIINVLDNITDPSSATIQIVNSSWTSCRINILQKVSDLMDRGANVEIIARSSVSKKIYDGLVDLANRGAFIKLYNYDEVHHTVKQIRTHSKVMLIRGEWKGNKTNIVITGSENYSCGSLKKSYNNNILLSSYNFNHPDIFKRYEDHFNKIKKLPGVCCMTND